MSQVSGLVVHFASPRHLDAVQETLRLRSSFELGDATCGAGLPVVLEAPDSKESKRQLEWLEGMDGVSRVDVVFVTCDEVPSSHAIR